MNGKNRFLLLKTLLKASSGINTIKCSTDRTKIRRAQMGFVGKVIILAMIIIYVGIAAFGLGVAGMVEVSAGLTALIISLISLVFTILKTNGYLFNFKEYDMLMAMPFSVKEVVSSKFLYMYVKSLPWYLCISLPFLIGTILGISVRNLPMVSDEVGAIAEISMVGGIKMDAIPNIGVLGIIFWIVLTFFLPLIPMLIASGVGVIIARLSSGFKQKRLIQSILTMIIIIPMFFAQYIVQYFAKDSAQLDNLLGKLGETIIKTGNIYWPVKWFTESVGEEKLSSALLLMGLSILLFELLFWAVSKNYRKINSALANNIGRKKVNAEKIKVRSIYSAIAYKEFKRFLGSTNYFVNCGMGQMLIVILSIVSIFVSIESIVGMMVQGVAVSVKNIIPAIPFVCHFLVGMVASTCCSPSLEGPNYWIIQSLPISKLDFFKGKILFNLYLTIPFMLLGIVCLDISADASVADYIVGIFVGIVLGLFSTIYGLWCGVKFMRLDWDNEIEVIKQGTAVPVYLFSNMIVTMLVIGVLIGLGNYVDCRLLSAVIALFILGLTAVFYLGIRRMARK